MRIEQIDLRRFGRFEQHALDLSGDAGMFVLYGGNEAGKTTTLDAITYALFGMPHGRSSENNYGFAHALPTLRVGLTVRRQDGRELSFLRKRGQKQTVLDATTDQASPELETALSALLGGVTRDSWRARHGLSQATLRSGADTILRSEGDAGDALFAAATGITVLRGVLDEVRARRQELLADSGRKGLIHDAVTAWDAARGRADAARREAQSYEQDVARRAEIERERERLRGELARVTARREQFEGARAVASELAARTELLRQRAAIAVPPDAWGAEQHDQLRAATEQRQQLAHQEAAARAALERHHEQLAEHESDPQLRAAHDSVESLLQRVELVRVAREQLAELEARHAAAIDAVRAAGATVDSDELDVEVLRRGIPDAAARRELRAAMDACMQIEQRRDQAREEVRAAERAVTQARTALAQVGDADDSALHLLEELVASVSRVDVDAHEQAAAAAAREREALEHAARALPGCDLTLDGVRALAVPATDTIRRHVARLQELEQQHEKLQEGLDRVREHTKRREGELRALEAGGPLPDPTELARLRHDRDELWGTIRDALEAPDPQALVPARTAAAGFEEASRRTDAWTDDAIRSGERLGKATGIRELLEQDQRREREHRTQLETLEAQRRDAIGQWQQLWQQIGLTADSPESMQELVAEVAAIKDRAQRLDDMEASVAGTAQRIDGAVRELSAALATAVPDRSDSAAFDALRAQAAARLKSASATATERTTLRTRLHAAEEQLAARTHALGVIDAEHDAWTERWGSACEAARMARATSIDVASAECDQHDALEQAIADYESARVELLKARSTIETFTSEVRGLLASLGGAADGIDATSPEIGIAALRERVATHVTAARLRDEIGVRIRELQDELEQIQRDQAAATSQLEALSLLAGNVEETALRDLDTAWAQRHALEQQLMRLDADILDRTGHPASILAEAVEEHDDGALAAAIAQLVEQSEELRERVRELTVQRDELVERIGSVETSKVLDEARQEQANALVRIEELVGEYRSLAIQEHQLATFMEDKSKVSMGPVLERASRYFARLTCDRYVALRPQTLDDGSVRLTALPATADGDATRAVDVAGLSEGTRDQLYLALRLATLMHAIDAGAEPMPLVVDDILLTFDDERSAATLSLLGELSEHMQVIFLTHHEHLVELAREHVLPGELLQVVTLDDGLRA